MREVIITYESEEMLHTILGIIKDPNFIGGDIDFSCYGQEGIDYDFFFKNIIDCEGFSLDSLPKNLNKFLFDLDYKGF